MSFRELASAPPTGKDRPAKLPDGPEPCRLREACQAAMAVFASGVSSEALSSLSSNRPLTASHASAGGHGAPSR